MTLDHASLAGEKRDLRRGVWQILSGSGIRIVARVLLITFVARMYGINDFGRLGETVAMVELLATFATFGLSKTLLGILGEDDPGAHAQASIAKAAALVGALSLGLVAILWVAWPYFASADLAGMQFVLLGIPLIALAEVATTATRHHRTAFWDTLVKAVVKPWSFLLLSVAAFYTVAGATLPSGQTISSETALLIAYVGSLLLTASAAGIALRKSFGTFSWGQAPWPKVGDVLGIGKRSWPIALNETGLFAFRRIDVIILAAVAGPKETAIYYMARQLSTVVEKVRHLYEPVLSPIIAQSKSLKTIESHLTNLGIRIFAVQLAILCLFAVFGSVIMGWFGVGFAAGFVVVLVMLVGELFDGGFGLCELPMVYRNPAWPPRLVLMTVALEIPLVWLLGEQFGAVGAAAGFALSMFVLALMRVAMVRNLYGFRVLKLQHLGLVASAALTLFIVNFIWPLQF